MTVWIVSGCWSVWKNDLKCYKIVQVIEEFLGNFCLQQKNWLYNAEEIIFYYICWQDIVSVSVV